MKILDLFNLTEQQQTKLAGLGDVQVIEPQDLNDNNSKEIDAIYGWDAHAEEVLTASPKLKFIQSNSAGVDYMPLSEFQKKGIIWQTLAAFTQNQSAKQSLPMFCRLPAVL
nr:hypothetical protein [Lentilactobacillus otakiensis]